MATYTKFNSFISELHNGTFSLLGSPVGDTIKLALVNSPAPDAGNTVFANLTEIGAGNGYTAGGETLANCNGVLSGATITVSADQVVWTASGGTIGALQYVVLYDDTPTTPTDPLIAFWDYGSSITLNDGETFTASFNNTSSAGTIYTAT